MKSELVAAESGSNMPISICHRDGNSPVSQGWSMGDGKRDLVERTAITALVTTVPWQRFPGPWRNEWSVGGGWVLLEGVMDRFGRRERCGNGARMGGQLLAYHERQSAPMRCIRTLQDHAHRYASAGGQLMESARGVELAQLRPGRFGRIRRYHRAVTLLRGCLVRSEDGSEPGGDGSAARRGAVVRDA